MNNISIVGRITKDVETETTTSGIEYARFNVAVQSEYRTADGEKKADFFPCVAWRETANNIAKYFKKGYPIGIVGSMNSRTYEKTDGTNQLIWEINVKTFSFVGGSNDEEKENKLTKTKTKTKKATSIPAELTPFDPDDDDLPF
jgi:single-strand DNA-binding protein